MQATKVARRPAASVVVAPTAVGTSWHREAAHHSRACSGFPRDQAAAMPASRRNEQRDFRDFAFADWELIGNARQGDRLRVRISDWWARPGILALAGAPGCATTARGDWRTSFDPCPEWRSPPASASPLRIAQEAVPPRVVSVFFLGPRDAPRTGGAGGIGDLLRRSCGSPAWATSARPRWTTSKGHGLAPRTEAERQPA